jgi:hypothetical protein
MGGVVRAWYGAEGRLDGAVARGCVDVTDRFMEPVGGKLKGAVQRFGDARDRETCCRSGRRSLFYLESWQASVPFKGRAGPLDPDSDENWDGQQGSQSAPSNCPR